MRSLPSSSAGPLAAWPSPAPPPQRGKRNSRNRPSPLNSSPRRSPPGCAPYVTTGGTYSALAHARNFSDVVHPYRDGCRHKLRKKSERPRRARTHALPCTPPRDRPLMEAVPLAARRLGSARARGPQRPHLAARGGHELPALPSEAASARRIPAPRPRFARASRPFHGLRNLRNARPYCTRRPRDSHAMVYEWGRPRRVAEPPRCLRVIGARCPRYRGAIGA